MIVGERMDVRVSYQESRSRANCTGRAGCGGCGVGMVVNVIGVDREAGGGERKSGGSHAEVQSGDEKRCTPPREPPDCGETLLGAG